MSASGSGAGRGIFLCVAIVVFGAVILGGMYIAPRAQSPMVPEAARALPPDKRLKFVSLDVQRRHPATTSILADLKRLEPDFVCLQNVESEDVVPIAEGLGMTKSFHMELFAPSQNLDGRHATFGNCVLAKGEIDAGAAISAPTGDFGAWGVAVVAGHKFRVASVQLSSGDARAGELNALVEAWQKADSMPIVVAGLWGKESATTDLVSRQTGWFDALTPFADLSRANGGDVSCRILFSPGWSSVAGGIGAASQAGAAPAWVVGTSMHAAMPATTRAVLPAGEEP